MARKKKTSITDEIATALLTELQFLQMKRPALFYHTRDEWFRIKVEETIRSYDNKEATKEVKRRLLNQFNFNPSNVYTAELLNILDDIGIE